VPQVICGSSSPQSSTTSGIELRIVVVQSVPQWASAASHCRLCGANADGPAIQAKVVHWAPRSQLRASHLDRD
jgi:hypothetical protein